MAEGEYKDKELLLFQLGPVQEFIAQAATVGDLWAGSYLLSMLVWAGLQKVPDKESKVVFPDLSTDTVRKALEEGKIGQSRYSSYVRLYELTAKQKPWEIKIN